MTRANGAHPGYAERDPPCRRVRTAAAPSTSTSSSCEDGIARPRPQTPAYPAITTAFATAFRDKPGPECPAGARHRGAPDRPQPRRQPLLPAIGALSEMPGPPAPARARIPLLARLKVGTKLMLLVLLPVCVLLGFTTITAVTDWRAASQLQQFQTATRLSFADGRVARPARRGTHRGRAAAACGPTPGPGRSGHGAAQREPGPASRPQGRPRAGHGTVDLAGRLSAARRQLGALRLQVCQRVAPCPADPPRLTTSSSTT